MSFDFSANPVNVTGKKATSKLEFDSTKMTENQMKAIENQLYGTEDADSELLMPDALFALIRNANTTDPETTEPSNP